MKNKGTYKFSGIVKGKQIECEYDYEYTYYPSTRETPEEYDENLNPTKLVIDGKEIDCIDDNCVADETTDFWDSFYDDSELFKTLAAHAQNIISEADSRHEQEMEVDFERDTEFDNMMFEMRALDERGEGYEETNWN